jgi:hypothetical protein
MSVLMGDDHPRHLEMTTRTSAGYSRRVLMHRAGAATASVALFALAGMHTAWGGGSSWPLPDPGGLSDPIGGSAQMPAPAACFAVSGAPAAAGALVAGCTVRWPLAHRLSAGTVAAVLAGRAGDVRLERMKSVAMAAGIPARLLRRHLATI